MATIITGSTNGYFPCVVVLSNGDWVVGWNINMGGALKLYKSTDQGETWSDISSDWMDGDSLYDFQTPELLELSNGNIIITYTYDLKSLKWKFYTAFRISTDGMATWSDEVVILAPCIDYAEGAAKKGKPIEMQSGHIGIPAYVRKGYLPTQNVNNLQFRNTFMRWHPDNGAITDAANWEMYYLEDWGYIGTACDEWHCIETHDAGKLIGFHRSGENAPSNYWKRTSTDQGETWSDKTLLFQNERATPEQALFLNPDTLMLTRTWRLSNIIKVLYSLDEGATFKAAETVILNGSYTSTIDLWYLSYAEISGGDFLFVYGYLGNIYWTTFSVYPDIYANVGGTFQQVKKVYAKNSGEWKPASTHANVSGTFTKIADIPQ